MLASSDTPRTYMLQAGRLEETPLTALLYKISANKATGTLVLQNKAQERAIIFDKGKAICATSNAPSEAFGAMLIKSGHLTFDSLQKAQDSQPSHLNLAAHLIQSGTLKQEVLHDALSQQTYERIIGSFALTRGEFAFEPGDTWRDQVESFPQDAIRIIYDGIRRHMAPNDVAMQLQDRLKFYVVRTEKFALFEPSFPADEWDRKVLASIHGDQTLQSMTMVYGAQVMRLLRVIWTLHCADMVDFLPEPRTEAARSQQKEPVPSTLPDKQAIDDDLMARVLANARTHRMVTPIGDALAPESNRIRRKNATRDRPASPSSDTRNARRNPPRGQAAKASNNASQASNHRRDTDTKDQARGTSSTDRSRKRNSWSAKQGSSARSARHSSGSRPSPGSSPSSKSPSSRQSPRTSPTTPPPGREELTEIVESFTARLEHEDSWQLLGVSRTSERAEVRESFRKVMAQLPPDKLKVLAPRTRRQAQKVLNALKEAFREVSDPPILQKYQKEQASAPGTTRRAQPKNPRTRKPDASKGLSPIDDDKSPAGSLSPDLAEALAGMSRRDPGESAGDLAHIQKLTRLKRWREAFAMAQKFVKKEQGQNRPANVLIAWIVYNLPHEDKAKQAKICRERIEFELQIDRRMPDAHFYLGCIAEEERDYAAAEKQFIATLKLHPNHTQAQHHLKRLKNRAQFVADEPTPTNDKGLLKQLKGFFGKSTS